MFLLSFTALFPELMVIRWVPSVVRLVACYANLIGALAGGFAEYLGMAVGSHHLSYLVIAAYAGSLLRLLSDRRSAATAPATV